MIYKFSNLIQTHNFDTREQFLYDLEETFVAEIFSNGNNDYRTMKIVAPKEFIKDIFYSLIMCPHTSENVVTRFSMFEEYTIEELKEIFDNDKNDVLMFTICQDRICFIDQLRYAKNNIIDEDDDSYTFVYLCNDVASEFTSELRSKRIPTLVVRFNNF